MVPEAPEWMLRERTFVICTFSLLSAMLTCLFLQDGCRVSIIVVVIYCLSRVSAGQRLVAQVDIMPGDCARKL